jgi:superfamily II DNA or RNA helicase
MNVSINNIKNCTKLANDEIRNLKNKLHIKNISSINNKKELCSIIKKKYESLCPCNLKLDKDTKLTLKKHQLSVANHLVNNKGAIIVHSVGTGKTLSAISTSQCLLLNNIVKKIIVITPTSLKDNFIKQMKMYNNNINFDNYYFYTIQGIVNILENNSKVVNSSDSLIIIDEAHNLRTINGSRFNIIFNYVKKAEKILLLTATPMINYKYDIINLVSLINFEKPISIEYFNNLLLKENFNKLKNYVKDIFSFYGKDKEDPNFPKKKIVEIYLEMDEKYMKLYNNIENGEASKVPDFNGKNLQVFYNGVRRASNIIDSKSPKIEWILEKINDHPNAKFVIFSHFINMGIKPIMKKLDKLNINYEHITGDLPGNKRGEAVNNYNSNKIKILFISKAGSEGLDLKNTTYIIIMESGWNENSIEQIIGRGVRYKSHENLSESKKHVTIYKLFSVKPYEYKHITKITNNYLLEFKNNILSVDLYLRNFSWIKQQEITSFYKVLQKLKFN